MQHRRCRGVLLALAILVAVSGTASAHFLGYSSVDAMEIRWGGSTQYTTQRDHSHSTWNALGKVNIAPDAWWTQEDLTYYDVNRTDIPNCGWYDYDVIGADDLVFNVWVMDSFGANQKKYCALHEVGHSLGLAHSFPGNVMDQSAATEQTWLGDHDREDYFTLYP